MREYFMRSLISIPLLLLLCGCADLGYYWHSSSGHLALMNQRVDIEDMLADEEIDEDLREQLLLVREMRRFSVERLALPDNGSYDSYVQLDRPWVVQNLFAAEEFSTQLQQWCYPIVGCASYRGYYDQERLRAFADDLEAQGLEIYVGDVPAYSTLGWFDDPVLSSFIDWPEHRLAGLIFHELTHQRIYLDGDSTFNESLATAVQQVGTGLWLKSRDKEAALDRMELWLAYREEVIALIVSTRTGLAGLYAGDSNESDMRAQKAMRIDEMRDAHAAIADRHGIKTGFMEWFAGDLNNAHLGSIATYNSRLAAFVAMIEAHGRDFEAFFEYVDRLVELDTETRNRCLDAWEPDSVTGTDSCPSLATGDA